MVRKIVDVFLQDKRIATYPVTWRDSKAPIPDSDFAERAKEALMNDYPKEKVAAARFVVSGMPG
jgi:hypothetical protein